MAHVLRPLGGTTDDLLRSNFLTTRGMEEWGVSSMVFRRNMYTTQGAAPTSTCVTVPFVNGDDEVVAVTDALALLPGEWKKEPVLDGETDMAYLPMSIAAGRYAFHTGFISMDKTIHGPVERLDQLGEGAHGLMLGRVDNNEAILAQSWHVYREIDRLLRAVGSDLSRVVQQTLLLRDARHYALVEQVGRRWFGAASPATTVVPCDDIGPYPGLLLEIESIALR
jgi:enamine deaminase RidA (YjgF/YER057c/UK114 family)